MEFNEVLKIANQALFASTKRHLTDLEVAIFRMSWEGKNYEQIAEQLGYHLGHIQQTGANLWKQLSEAVKEEVNKKSFREPLKRWKERQEIDIILQPPVDDQYQELAHRPDPVASELILPGGVMPRHSVFYVERSDIESRCYEAITQAGALICIKAPEQMGKTSLLYRILDHSVKLRYRTVFLNLMQAEEAVFGTLDDFLQWFCALVSQKLKLPSQINDYWSARGSIVNCTTYFQEHLLEQVDSPLVLALDNVDNIFRYPTIARDFLDMLRTWNEEAQNLDVWGQLRLVVVHSTEKYRLLLNKRSPFENVGLPMRLTDFTSAQVKDLAGRYKLDWGDAQVQQLMAMVEGHPYLVHLALYHLACQDATLEQLLQDAPTDTGIYQAHLRQHLQSLQEDLELAAAFKHVVTTTEPVRLETMQAYKLDRMGLIKRQSDLVTQRCKLYQQYFRDRLSNEKVIVI